MIIVEQERHEREISNVKKMIMSEFYIENRKSLIDTLAARGGSARMALLDIIDKLGDNHELKTSHQKARNTIGQDTTATNIYRFFAVE